MSTRRPTPRERRELPSAMSTALFCIFMVVLLIASTWWGMTHMPSTEAELRPGNTIKHDSLAPTYTHDGEIIRWYVFTDPDTGVQYLVNDRGGCVTRLEGDGMPMGIGQGGDWQ